MKITFLSSFANHARHRKRLRAFHEIGAETSMLAFERDFYPAAGLPPYRSLGKIQQGRYLTRLIHILSAVPKVRSVIKNSDILYMFDFDMLLLGMLASAGLNIKKVFEIGDIHNIFATRGIISKLFQIVEKFLAPRTDLLVVTSQAYINGYYAGILRIKKMNCFVLENKVDAHQLRKIISKPATRNHQLIIGFFGGLQCVKSWNVLTDVVKKSNGKIRVYVRGLSYVFQKELEKKADLMPDIEYGGPYKNPDELPELYHQVDLVWIAHHHGATNVLWARANRFYESCFFRKPMIAQRDTEDGRVVEAFNIGVCIDLNDMRKSIDSILNIRDSEINKWHENIKKLPVKVYTYTDEHEKLLRKLGV